MIGRIAKIVGRTYEVATEAGILSCTFRGRLKKERKPSSVRLAALGDEVVATATGDGEGVIEEVRPRRSKLSRPDPANLRKEQILVANVDAILIVESVRQPDLDLLTIDRCTVMASAAGIPAAVCVNKSDLGPAEGLEVYPPLDIPVFLTAASRGDGIAGLRAFLQGKTTVLIGPSGVGKSSLLNALHPGSSARTGKVSERTGGGRHTTSWSELVEIGPGTFVADTPGLEIFALWEITPGTLRDYFPEFAGRAERCKYRNCSHLKEPHCAVLEALRSGAIAPSRHAHYAAIRQGLIDRPVLFG
ncbi:MAG TPA: ribosome small subunit-dependent GTPase A [Planctomycetota bacterium]